MAMAKKPAPRKPTVSRTPSKGVMKLMPKVQGAKPGVKRLMAYNPNNYINGVDQRTYAQQERDAKQDAAKAKTEITRRAASLKKYKAKRQDEIMVGVKGQNRPKSPSPSDISNGKLRKKSK